MTKHIALILATFATPSFAGVITCDPVRGALLINQTDAFSGRYGLNGSSIQFMGVKNRVEYDLLVTYKNGDGQMFSTSYKGATSSDTTLSGQLTGTTYDPQHPQGIRVTGKLTSGLATGLYASAMGGGGLIKGSNAILTANQEIIYEGSTINVPDKQSTVKAGTTYNTTINAIPLPSTLRLTSTVQGASVLLNNTQMYTGSNVTLPQKTNTLSITTPTNTYGKTQYAFNLTVTCP